MPVLPGLKVPTKRSILMTWTQNPYQRQPMTRMISFETRASEPIPAGDKTITPFAQALHLHIPVFNLDCVWNRPVSVHIRTVNGEEYVAPVVDVTRIAIWSTLGASLLIGIILRLVTRKKS
jgi:hypothetical protein